ncbi:Uncharacterised protein [Flavonifractor plautii]|uniref:Uncharacterized protein n=1 Tax=Flavonifractor plautii TaxID=292800 RepID=A0A174TDH1_FLAPL|nr:Uncharacterised protein [Flavonifractor plautii]
MTIWPSFTLPLSQPSPSSTRVGNPAASSRRLTSWAAPEVCLQPQWQKYTAPSARRRRASSAARSARRSAPPLKEEQTSRRAMDS